LETPFKPTKPGAHSGMQPNLGGWKISKALLGLCKIWTAVFM